MKTLRYRRLRLLSAAAMLVFGTSTWASTLNQNMRLGSCMLRTRL